MGVILTPYKFCCLCSQLERKHTFPRAASERVHDGTFVEKRQIFGPDKYHSIMLLKKKKGFGNANSGQRTNTSAGIFTVLVSFLFW
jgi:hypothetical protein